MPNPGLVSSCPVAPDHPVQLSDKALGGGDDNMKVKRGCLAPLLSFLTTHLYLLTVPRLVFIPQVLHLPFSRSNDTTVVLCLPTTPPQEKKNESV